MFNQFVETYDLEEKLMATFDGVGKIPSSSYVEQLYSSCNLLCGWNK